ncbi:DUF6551 family protein [Nocardia niwae]|uniref:DUF6551 family protein n=1 Tax=Nocardia niwae TaxID=626084 RepID=UPI0033FB1D1A
MPDTAVLDRRPDVDEAPAIYITAISVDQMFVDHTYQRDLDMPRARRMSREWDPRLVGVIEVSDRGPRSAQGRYAIVNGQHRWAAAGLRDPNMVMVANVHTGLSVTQEALLFREIDTQTRRLTTWDRWHARRAAGEPVVLDIEEAVAAAGLTISMAPKDGNIRCTSTLERIHRLGGTLLLGNTLRFITDIWGRRLDAVDAPLVLGLAEMLHTYDDELDHRRLGDVLIDYAPRQIKARAQAMRETETGKSNGTLAALVMLAAYNNHRSPKLDRPKLSR